MSERSRHGDLASRVVREDERLLPPPPGVRHVMMPAMRVVVVSDHWLRARVEKFFHWPMIILALLILPLLAVELFVQPSKHSVLWWSCAAGLAVIWLAFVVEFIVKIMIAECRIEYVKRNWIDVIIIMAPALRTLRILQVVKFTQVFTIRGVGYKVARLLFTVFIGMEATDRLLRRIGLRQARKRRDPDAMTRHQISQELRRLRRQNDAWRDWYADHYAHLQAKGVWLPHEPAPVETILEAADAGEEESA